MMTTDNTTSPQFRVSPAETESLLPRIVTTSWDDGDACDLKLAELLHARKLPGTFYIPITGHHGARSLGRNEMRALKSEGFEIGGHGFSHLILPHCTKEMMVREVITSKQELEDILGSEVRMFAYPCGRYSSLAIRYVRKAGFAGARTTEMFAQGFNYDPYRMPTTIHVFPHSKSDYIRNTARAVNIGKAWRYLTELWQAKNWVDLAKLLFDSVIEEGGVFHLYGHSWEIDELELWDDLAEVLDYVSSREDVLYLTNGSILAYSTARPSFDLEAHCALEG